MKKIINEKFFNRPTIKVAKDLLGKFLVRKIGKKKIYLMITEVEVYDGLKDKASHASRGITKRNKIMFGKAGYFYVYFVYGMHNMLNIVVGSKNYPAAILLRGGIVIPDNKNYKLTDLKTYKLISGPARLAKFLKIDRKFNGLKAIPKNNLWFEYNGRKNKPSQIIAKKRVGVSYAGPVWANKKYNFSIKI